MYVPAQSRDVVGRNLVLEEGLTCPSSAPAAVQTRARATVPARVCALTSLLLRACTALRCRSSSISNAVNRQQSQSLVSTREASESSQVSKEIANSVENSQTTSDTVFDQVGRHGHAWQGQVIWQW